MGAERRRRPRLSGRAAELGRYANDGCRDAVAFLVLQHVVEQTAFQEMRIGERLLQGLDDAAAAVFGDRRCGAIRSDGLAGDQIRRRLRQRGLPDPVLSSRRGSGSSMSSQKRSQNFCSIGAAATKRPSAAGIDVIARRAAGQQRTTAAGRPFAGDETR